MNAEKIVEAQVAAYNERNLIDFVNCHSEDIELYNYPDTTPYATGRESLKARYGDVFENSPDLHTEILKRISLGKVVIDYERVTGRKEVESMLIIAIYEIENGLIAKARFIREG